ncbi:MAG TPA: response regulator transcription factor [Streptosporangiaceae bacterium]|nr:response regulator transcription factor [Streptosporangiaceae bacterium]
MSTDRLARPRTTSGILLVDDEPRIQSFISRALAEAGYATVCASGGADALRLATTGEYGLVILDLVMPDVDGRAVLAELLRVHPEQPVLMLSCVDDAATKAACLDLGADDYLTKPFALEELLARVRVQLRGDPRHEVLRSGELRLDVGRMQADTGQGPIALTRLEFLLLRELMEHAGHSVPKDQLLASIWGYDFDPGSNVVDVCVRRLRSKLGFELIRTVRGAGYHLAS